MTRRAFTLIELLVVIAIIGILAAAIQPGLMAANEYARLLVCRSRLTELGLAFRLYMEDWDAPPADLQLLHVAGYVEDASVLECAHAHAPFTYLPPGPDADRGAIIARCPDYAHGDGRKAAVLLLNGRTRIERKPR